MVEQAGADWIHIDVMDGHFVPNLTMGPFIVETCRKITSLPLDVHLMVLEPEKMLADFANAGADILTVHIETCPHINSTIQSIQDLGCQAGVTLNPGTPAIAVKEVLPYIDLVLVMTVNPGFSGQKFIPGIIPKIARVRQLLESVNPSGRIQVDGGISAETICSARDAGADVFVAASAIFNHPDGPRGGIEALKTALH
jgi:ribulose-phosphate 3-epimerase